MKKAHKETADAMSKAHENTVKALEDEISSLKKKLAVPTKEIGENVATALVIGIGIGVGGFIVYKLYNLYYQNKGGDENEQDNPVNDDNADALDND